MKFIEKSKLEDYYLQQKLNPYQIAQILKCDHKTVRSYLNMHNIPKRSASEYNFLSRKSHTAPTKDLLMSNLSIAAHTAYICEGWHTEKTLNLDFINQDIVLINLFENCILHIYKYTTTIPFEIRYKPDDLSSKIKVEQYVELLGDRKINFTKDYSRKNPIISVRVGGKNLAREFIANAYEILHLMVKPGAYTNFATIA